jgi:phytoene desaturase
VGNTSTKRIGVIGSGFSGLAAACVLADAGHEVHVFEKNNQLGGRGKSFETQGFVFDMGPSWYWMPEVMESFFQRFGKQTSDYFELQRLDPSYRVFFAEGPIDIPADVNQLGDVLESIETGAKVELFQFMDEAKVKYEKGLGDFVWKPGHHVSEFMKWDLLKGVVKLDLFRDMRSHLKSHFKHPKILALMEFPVLFLGAKPEKTPALYSLMNYADIQLGTWYPMGGMAKLPEAMISLAKELGVHFHADEPVQGIEIIGGAAAALRTEKKIHSIDAVIGAADYHHIEQNLIPPAYRQYDEKYWNKRVMAPSSLLFYVGLNTTLPGILHHNLFFDESFDQHAVDIYDHPKWPDKPLFYVCCPSKTDHRVAPAGKENLFFLIPVAHELQSGEEVREKYWNMLCDRLQQHTGHDIRPHVEYKRSYAHEEFVAEYNSFKGNAYGLANTLSQTAFLKPKMRSTKISNMYYAGQLTTPGPGVPPTLISGQLAAQELLKQLK